MAEALGAAGSIVGIVSFGLQFATSLQTYLEAVAGAEESMQDIAFDINATASALKQLHDLIEADKAATGNETRILNSKGVEEVLRLSAQCEKVYTLTMGLIAKAARPKFDGQSGGPAVTAKWEDFKAATLCRRLRWPWLEPRIKKCQDQLRWLKVTLLFQLQLAQVARMQLQSSARSPGMFEEELASQLLAKNLHSRREKLTKRLAKQTKNPRSLATFMANSSIYSESDSEASGSSPETLPSPTARGLDTDQSITDGEVGIKNEDNVSSQMKTRDLSTTGMNVAPTCTTPIVGAQTAGPNETGGVETLKPKDDTQAPAATPDTSLNTILLMDEVGNKHVLPLESCRTWQEMHGLVKGAFRRHSPAFSALIEHGHYDLVDSGGNMILSPTWDQLVQPGWVVKVVPWRIYHDRVEQPEHWRPPMGVPMGRGRGPQGPPPRPRMGPPLPPGAALVSHIRRAPRYIELEAKAKRSRKLGASTNRSASREREPEANLKEEEDLDIIDFEKEQDAAGDMGDFLKRWTNATDVWTPDQLNEDILLQQWE
ncbi:uncharacterized protein JN550_001502 [Neoarthrinium moseri]|uniref:uncharacterized protein n=1 Tax=Neoarthrinium moseri TaxID=1658444 RepID=UPI001FDDE7BF|nr:uncharacterized protein JN550_001502 [Neoarthrinium moseri]KAI1876006.1 hypothetical protein JN550_001502 [Neoarthrinium moseri]